MKSYTDSTDDRDTSAAPTAASTLRTVRQTNGVIRIHAVNGGYLFSIVRGTDGAVYQFEDGFGTHTAPKKIY